MKKLIIAIIAMVLAPTLSYAGSKAEVLHWWTSGGEAKALKVLKDDFAAKGGEWLDMPVAGASGDNVAWLKAHELRKVGDEVSHAKHHSVGAAVLSALSVHVQIH